jgi:hypothetical protein
MMTDYYRKRDPKLVNIAAVVVVSPCVRGMYLSTYGYLVIRARRDGWGDLLAWARTSNMTSFNQTVAVKGIAHEPPISALLTSGNYRTRTEMRPQSGWRAQ